MTQQNAALVEQSAAAAESLSDQASKLPAVVGFKLDGQRRSAAPQSTAHRRRTLPMRHADGMPPQRAAADPAPLGQHRRANRTAAAPCTNEPPHDDDWERF